MVVVETTLEVMERTRSRSTAASEQDLRFISSELKTITNHDTRTIETLHFAVGPQQISAICATTSSTPMLAAPPRARPPPPFATLPAATPASAA